MAYKLRVNEHKRPSMSICIGTAQCSAPLLSRTLTLARCRAGLGFGDTERRLRRTEDDVC